MVKLFIQDEHGGISAEYVAILALIVVISMGALDRLGVAITGVVASVQRGLTTPN